MLQEYDTYMEAEDPANVPPETFTEELGRSIASLLWVAHIRLLGLQLALQQENDIERQARGRIWRRHDSLDALLYLYDSIGIHYYAGVVPPTNRLVWVDEA